VRSSTGFTFRASIPAQSKRPPNTTLCMVAVRSLLALSDALFRESIRLGLVMIDWITCQVSVSSLPETGRRTHSTKHGELILDGRLPEYLESSETKIFCIPFGDHLLISGNPSKYLQGHNVISVDSWDVVESLVETVCCHFDIKEWEIISVSRIDITYSYLLDSDLDVELSLTELGKCTAERWGRPVIKHGTNYWGNAKRSQLKAYAKAPEFKRRNRKSILFNQYKLPPILRFEHTLGRNHWQEHSWKILKDDKARKELWSKAMERLRINELETVDISKIPRKLQ